MYIAQINQLLNGWIYLPLHPHEVNHSWNEWLDSEPDCGPEDLKDLLQEKVHLAFKGRALVVLLSPDLHNVPFRWSEPNEFLPNYLSWDWLQVKTLPKELVRFTGELICINFDYAFSRKEEAEQFPIALAEYGRIALQYKDVLLEHDRLLWRLLSRQKRL